MPKTSKDKVAQVKKATKGKATREDGVNAGTKVQNLDDVKYVYEKLGGMDGWAAACKEDKTVKSDFYKNVIRPRVEDQRKKTADMADDGRDILRRVDALVVAFKQRGEDVV